MLHPDGTMNDQLFLPGSYRIGSGERCEIKLRDDDVLSVAAVLEWSGNPNLPHLRPLGAGRELIAVNDEPVDGTVQLPRDSEFSVGGTRMAVIYD